MEVTTRMTRRLKECTDKSRDTIDKVLRIYERRSKGTIGITARNAVKMQKRDLDVGSYHTRLRVVAVGQDCSPCKEIRELGSHRREADVIRSTRRCKTISRSKRDAT